MLMVEEVEEDCLLKRGWPKLVQKQKLFGDECRHIWNHERALMQVALKCLPATLVKNQQKQVQATVQTVKEEQS